MRDWSREIQTILNDHEINGGPFWSRKDGDIHAPHGYSTIDVLGVLGELGANTVDYTILSDAVEFIFQYQAEDGSFRYGKKSSKLPCMTALILAGLGRLGMAVEPRAINGFQWLLKTQWSDGGWRCNTVKLGNSPLTDASNPGTTLYVLDAFRFRKNPPSVAIQLDKGVDFLLQHWEVKIPVGPCYFGIGSRFNRVEYPFLRYNLFYYVYVLSHYPAALYDRRFKEAYEKLLSKTSNGSIILENPHRAWRRFDFAKTSQPSELADERWQEIRNNVCGDQQATHAHY